MTAKVTTHEKRLEKHKFLSQERENIVSSFHSIYNYLDMLLSD